MRTAKIPHAARHLRTYAEFESYLVDFVAGRYPFLWIVGRPGVGKTESIKAAVRGREVYYRKSGQLTPARFYDDLFRHRGQPVILDDSEHLLEDRIGAKLVAALGDTTPVKVLSWGIRSPVMGNVPDVFSTTSPLCILANRSTAHAAIQSRAVILYFDPTNLEIHRAVARWFWDQEIHDWFGRHLHRLLPLDARWYVIADQDKRSLRDWRQIILTTHATDRAACLVQDLEGDPAYPTREDKGRRFVELVGKAKGASRRSYFRLRKRLEVEGRLRVETVPPIPLRRTRPPGVPSLLELEAMEADPARQSEEEPAPLDLPAREQFAQPVRGQAPPHEPAPRPALDDSLPWEDLPRQDDEDDGDD
jgi:hypothetical protein